MRAGIREGVKQGERHGRIWRKERGYSEMM